MKNICYKIVFTIVYCSNKCKYNIGAYSNIWHKGLTGENLRICTDEFLSSWTASMTLHALYLYVIWNFRQLLKFTTKILLMGTTASRPPKATSLLHNMVLIDVYIISCDVLHLYSYLYLKLKMSIENVLSHSFQNWLNVLLF